MVLWIDLGSLFVFENKHGIQVDWSLCFKLVSDLSADCSGVFRGIVQAS